MSHRSLGLIGLLPASLALVACSVRLPPPDPPLRPSPTATALRPAASSPAPSPSVAPVWTPLDPNDAPEPPTGELPRSAFVEQDGIRVTITLERNPMPAGGPTWVTTQLRNIATEDLVYADDCSLVGVGGELGGASWRPGFAFDGKAGEYKDWALDELALLDGSIHVGFTPEWAVDQGLEAGEYGCADVLIPARLGPGEARIERARWSGSTTLSNAPPPSGPVALTGLFSFYWRDAEGNAPPGAHERQINVSLDAWIIGPEPPLLIHPTEAIDIAIADPVFGPWVLGRPFRSGADWRMRFDSTAAVWRVGLESFNPASRLREVLIDGATGLVIGYEGPTE